MEKHFLGNIVADVDAVVEFLGYGIVEVLRRAGNILRRRMEREGMGYIEAVKYLYIVLPKFLQDGKRFLGKYVDIVELSVVLEVNEHPLVLRILSDLKKAVVERGVHVLHIFSRHLVEGHFSGMHHEILYPDFFSEIDVLFHIFNRNLPVLLLKGAGAFRNEGVREMH